jgi:hypothetical protein
MTGATRRRRGKISPAMIAASVAVVLASGVGGFAIATGLSSADEGRTPLVTSSDAAPATTPTPTPTPEAEVVPLPASCGASYPVSLIERDGSGFLTDDPARLVDERVASDEVSALLATLDGVRCSWLEMSDGSGGSKVDSAAVSVSSGQTMDIAALLRASGARCATVRSGIVCVVPTTEVTDGSVPQWESHMIRDGIWSVHVGGEDTPEYAAAMGDALYGEITVESPAT